MVDISKNFTDDDSGKLFGIKYKLMQKILKFRNKINLFSSKKIEKNKFTYI